MTRQDFKNKVKFLHETMGVPYTEIGKRMGLPESTVRSLLDPNSEARMMQAKNTADFIYYGVYTAF